MGSKQVRVLEALFGPLRWLGADTSLPLAFRLQPFSLVSDLEERGCEICEGLPSGWIIIRKMRKRKSGRMLETVLLGHR